MKIARCNCQTSNESRGIYGPLVPVEEKDGFCVHCNHAVVYTSSYDRFPRSSKQSIRSGYRPISHTPGVWIKNKMDMEVFHTLMNDPYPEQAIEITELAEDLNAPAIDGFRSK